jgi:hypothetical protein
MVGKAKAAAQGPARHGTGHRRAGDDAEEIATHTVIDAMATSVGDKQTSKLALNVVHDTIPISQIDGDAGRRTPRHAKTPSRGASSARPKRAKGAKKGS